MYSVADVHNGLVKGLRANGCEVLDFKFDDIVEFFARCQFKQDNGRYKKVLSQPGVFEMASEHLTAAIYRFWPDVVILTSGFWIPPTLLHILRARPHHVVAFFTESPYEDGKQLAMSTVVDTVIVNDPTNLQKFQEVNPRSFYFPHSYDPDLHYPGKWPKACDVAFVGTGFPSRVEFMEQIDWTGIDLRLGGMWAYNDDDSPLNKHLVTGDPLYCMDNAVTADLYRSAKASFNLYRKEISAGGTPEGWAMGPREVELAATRTWFAREPRPEGDFLFPMLPTFTEPAELEQLLRWAITHESSVKRAAGKARAAIEDRTFTNTARRLLSLVDTMPRTLAA